MLQPNPLGALECDVGHRTGPAIIQRIGFFARMSVHYRLQEEGLGYPTPCQPALAWLGVTCLEKYQRYAGAADTNSSWEMLAR